MNEDASGESRNPSISDGDGRLVWTLVDGKPCRIPEDPFAEGQSFLDERFGHNDADEPFDHLARWREIGEALVDEPFENLGKPLWERIPGWPKLESVEELQAALDEIVEGERFKDIVIPLSAYGDTFLTPKRLNEHRHRDLGLHPFARVAQWSGPESEEQPVSVSESGADGVSRHDARRRELHALAAKRLRVARLCARRRTARQWVHLVARGLARLWN